MSNLEVEAERQALEASGEGDFIRQHLAAARSETPAEAVADTVEETEQEPVVEEVDSTEEEVPADAGIEAEAELTPEEEDVLYLELDDATQRLIDTKYGGDLNKALAALADGQSLIGRQGSELGDLRRELQELRQSVERGQVMAQPYPEWPDEYAEPGESVVQFKNIAEMAFEREDEATLTQSLAAWNAVDPVGASLFRDLKILQLNQQTAMAAPQNDEAAFQAGVHAVGEKYPQMQDDAFKAEFDAEMQRFPALKGLLWGEIPGTTPDQRIAALEDAVSRVASRMVSDTEQQARRRVAVKRSEEARAARVEARVASGESARVAEPEQERRVVPMGESGAVLDLDRLNSMLSPEDRI